MSSPGARRASSDAAPSRRRPGARARAPQPCAPAPRGRRCPSRSRALGWSGPSLSRAPQAGRQAPGPGSRPHSPPSSAPAPRTSAPPRGRGGEEVSVGAGERPARLSCAPGLEGTTDLQPRGWLGRPRPLPVLLGRRRLLPGGVPPLPS